MFLHGLRSILSPQLEHDNGTHQVLGLRLEASCRRRHFLNQGGILLRCCVHFRHCFANLRDALALFCAGRADFTHHLSDLADGTHHLGHSGTSLVHQNCALLNALNAEANQGLNLVVSQ